MRCGVLGPLEVLDGERFVAVPQAKERRLLGILVAAYPAAVSIDRLLDDLWEGRPPPTARKTLQAHVMRLRNALEPDRPHGSAGRYVIRSPGGYVLGVPRSDIDALSFVDSVARGRALLSTGDFAGAKAVLDDALVLWRGMPYAEWPDAAFADTERHHLETLRTDCVCARLEADMALGHHREAVAQLEQMVAEDPLREEPWSMLAIALYRCGRQGDALATIRRARTVLVRELGVSPGPLLTRTEKALLSQDPSLEPPHAPQPTTGNGARDPSRPTCPYKGLAAYGPEDTSHFRGRERVVERLLGSLVDNRVLVVSGSSGAGKSSVVRAGLLPALAAGALPGSRRWSQRVITPGACAVDDLAGLGEGAGQDGQVVLVVDQLEQQWSTETDPAERDAFIATLLGLVEEGTVARLVLVVRGDHIARLAEQAGMAERMIGALELVPPMTESELREAVEGPAVAVGVEVESDLVDAVIREALGRPGTLPLMSMALVGTWARRRDHTLTLAGYVEAGGVTGAVARTAEDVYAAFDSEGRQIARRIFARLAEQDEHGALRSRPVPVDELAFADVTGSVRRHVIETLVTHRLLTLTSSHVEVAHEALLSAWPRLTRWLDDDAAGRAVRRHLAPAAREWHRQGRPDDELYRGARLEAAAQWMADPEADPSPTEREFVQAGVTLAEAELTAARAHADAEARSRLRIRRLAVGLTGALVVALLAAGLAIGYQRSAEDRAAEARAARTVADANRLAALSTAARSLDLSLLLAAAGMRTVRTPATEEALFDALLTHRRATAVHFIGDQVEETAVSADGTQMFAILGGATTSVVSWRLGSPKPGRTIHEAWTWGLGVSPTGDVVAIATARRDGSAVVRAFSAVGDPLGSARGRHALGGFPIDLAYTADGRLLALVSRDHSDGTTSAHVTELDLEQDTHGPMRLITRSSGPVDFLWGRFTEDEAGVGVTASSDGPSGATFVNLTDGSRSVIRQTRTDRTEYDILVAPTGLLRIWADGAMTRYDSSGEPAQVLEAHAKPAFDVAVTPDGRAAATVGQGGEVVLWNVAPDSGTWTRRESLVGHTGEVRSVEVSPDGTTLFTVSQDGMLITWDLTGTRGFGGSYGSLGDRWISNRIQVVEPGRVVVAPARSLPGWGERGSGKVDAVFLDPRTGKELDRVFVGRTETGAIFGSSVAVSPDRTRVAVTHSHGTALIDTRTHEVVGRVALPPAGSALATFIWTVEWTPDGSRLLLGGLGGGDEPRGLLTVVDSRSLEVVKRIRLPHEAQVQQWSPDGTTLAIGTQQEPTVTFLDGDLEITHTVATGDHPFDLAWSPDGERLAAGGDEGEVSVIDVAARDVVNPPVKVFGAPIVDVEWLRGSDAVVASGFEGVAVIYDVERDVVRAGVMSAADQPSAGFAFLLPGPTDEVVVLNGLHPGHRYPLDPDVWLAEACRIAGRDLTQAEWDRYVPTEPYRPTCRDHGSG